MEPSELAALRDRAGILLDFDGTLSEIAPTPEEARPVPGALQALQALQASYAVVAVVSGRPWAQVSSLVGDRVRCFGLYGLDDGSPPDASSRARIERIIPQVRAASHGVPGAVVEPKGLTVAVHYRGARDPEEAGRALRRVLAPLARREGLALLDGKRVVELAPAGAPTKGDVVRRVAREHGLAAIVYAGDDVADLEAFSAVEELAGSGVAGLTVAVRSAETPDALVERAALVVEGPQGLVSLLRELA
jgi:trehalose 6-phosphate phosphatase